MYTDVSDTTTILKVITSEPEDYTTQQPRNYHLNSHGPENRKFPFYFHFRDVFFLGNLLADLQSSDEKLFRLICSLLCVVQCPTMSQKGYKYFSCICCFIFIAKLLWRFWQNAVMHYLLNRRCIFQHFHYPERIYAILRK